MSELLTLRQLRLKTRLSRQEFAQLSGIDYRTITRAEIPSFPLEPLTALWLIAVFKAYFEQHPELVNGFTVPSHPEEVRGLGRTAGER
jgi:transcriptional regulator with XRE-family HTH domain